jgi:hypothetical protein
MTNTNYWIPDPSFELTLSLVRDDIETVDGHLESSFDLVAEPILIREPSRSKVRQRQFLKLTEYTMCK